MPELRENSIDGFLRLGHRLFFCPCQGFQSWSGEQEVGQHGSAGMPAKDGGQLVGIISIGDVLKHRLGELQVEAEVLRDCGAPVETDPLNREKPNVRLTSFSHVLVAASHMPPAFLQSASVVAAATSPAKAGAVKARLITDHVLITLLSPTMRRSASRFAIARS
jgi:hypothetical protein